MFTRPLNMPLSNKIEKMGKWKKEMRAGSDTARNRVLASDGLSASRGRRHTLKGAESQSNLRAWRRSRVGRWVSGRMKNNPIAATPDWTTGLVWSEQISLAVWNIPEWWQPRI